MERGEPALKPEWLKSSSSNGGVLSHHANDVGFSSRSNLMSAGDRERSSFPSYSRSSSLNGYKSYDKDSSSKSRAYSSFGKSSRSRERNRDFDFCDKEIKSGFVENGFHDRFGRSEKDTLRRSQSMVTRKPADTWPEGLGINSDGVHHHRGSIVGSLFEKDFPSLGAEEKNGRLEVGRVSSPGISSPIQSIPVPSSAFPGLESWNSVLVEAPTTVGANGLGLPSGVQPTNQVPAAPTSTTGLNMAETVAQAPSRVRTPPQLSIDAHKNEELTRKYVQLIPRISSSKNSVSSSSESLKNKGIRGADSSCAYKLGSQMLSQPISAVLRTPIRPDSSKPSHVGTFQVLNREKNISPSIKDGPSVSKPVNPVGMSPSASIISLNSPTNPRSKGDGKGTTISSSQNPFNEKRSQSNAKDRYEFFNIIRSKASSGSSATSGSAEIPSSSNTLNSEKQSNSPCDSGTDSILLSTDMKHLGNGTCNDHERLPSGSQETTSYPELDPVKEEALLRLLGWDENAEEDPLTEEEISDFYMKYKDRLQSSKFSELKI